MEREQWQEESNREHSTVGGPPESTIATRETGDSFANAVVSETAYLD
jgi:hypothetical protein